MTRLIHLAGQDKLLVSEVFGPTLQGEGPSCGKAAAFVRLGNCNLTCTWCDSSYTWDDRRHELSSELAVRDTLEVARQVISMGTPLVIITGGEPALQAVQAARLAHAVTASGAAVELETSGSVPIGELADAMRLIVVSPKLHNSGIPERRRLRWEVLNGIFDRPNAVLKFVLQSPNDLAEADYIASRLAISSDRIWAMPEGTEPSIVLSRMAALAPEIVRRGWCLSTRLHILLWGDKRGH